MPDETRQIRFPDVTVQVSGEDGNGFAILGRVIKALRRGGAKDPQIQEFLHEARSGDYDHLLATVMEWVDAS